MIGPMFMGFFKMLRPLFFLKKNFRVFAKASVYKT